MTSRLSVKKLTQLLHKARGACMEEKEFLAMRPRDLVHILKYIQDLHWAMRDIQLTLIRASASRDVEALEGACEESLVFIEDVLGEVETLFEDISEVEED